MILEGQKAPAFSLQEATARNILWPIMPARMSCSGFILKTIRPGCTKEACGFRDTVETVTGRTRGSGRVSRDSLDSTIIHR